MNQQFTYANREWDPQTGTYKLKPKAQPQPATDTTPNNVSGRLENTMITGLGVGELPSGNASPPAYPFNEDYNPMSGIGPKASFTVNSNAPLPPPPAAQDFNRNYQQNTTTSNLPNTAAQDFNRNYQQNTTVSNLPNTAVQDFNASYQNIPNAPAGLPNTAAQDFNATYQNQSAGGLSKTQEATADAERLRAENERLQRRISDAEDKAKLDALEAERRRKAAAAANPEQNAPTITTTPASLGAVQASTPTTTAVAPLESVMTAGRPSDASAKAVGGSSERELREQQMQMAADAIGKGEKFAQGAVEGLRDFNITDAGMKFADPAATSQQIELDRFTPVVDPQQIKLDTFSPDAQARDATLAAFDDRINLKDFAPTAGASEFETSFGDILLDRLRAANSLSAGGYDPTTAALLADLDDTAARQRERDIAQLNRLGVLQSGNTADIFQEGNQALRRDRLAAIAAGYGLSQTDPALSTAMDLARLASDRGITGDDQRLTARDQDLSAGEINVGAGLDAREQDLEATLANQLADLDAQRLNIESGIEARGQDLEAGRLNQDTALQGQLAAMESGLKARGQDLTAAELNQLADLDAQTLNMEQQLGIADRQLTDAARRSEDERFAADLGLRQLDTQQDIADRVTGRQLIMGDPTSRELFEEDVRRARVGEGQFTDELQQERDLIGMRGKEDRLMQSLINQGELSKLARQGFDEQELQRLVNEGDVASLKQAGLNDQEIQRLMGDQEQTLQRIINQGDLSRLAREGFDTQELQRIINEGQLGLQRDANRFAEDLAVGQFGERDTLEKIMTDQDLALRRGMDPLAISDAQSTIDERNIGQYLALAQMLPEGLQRDAINQEIQNMLSTTSPDVQRLLRNLFRRPNSSVAPAINPKTPPPSGINLQDIDMSKMNLGGGVWNISPQDKFNIQQLIGL